MMNSELSFGAWLKKRRKALDLTQKELADRVCCAVITLQKIEANERRPSAQIAALLAEHLAISPEDRAAFISFARTPPGLPAALTSGAWRHELHRLTNLPTPLTPLIGREHDIAVIRERLLDGASRLLTLVGPPGVGKTRLAIQAAASLADDFGDGLCYVALAALSDPDLVPAAIAGTLSVNEMPGQSLASRLKTYLGEKHLLLVLDNFEHVGAAAPLLGELLEACPWLTIMVTSRTPLRIRGERQYAVVPLLTPAGEPETVEPTELLRYSAVALFVERSQAGRSAFTLTRENAAAVAALCVRLDGLPLAIELVAARIAALPPRALLERLDGSLLLHADWMRDASPRHRTLHDAIEWSYALLTPHAQRYLARSSVFMDGWTLDAADGVLSIDQGVSDDSRTNLDVLTSLVESNLVVRLKRQGETRFALLETIRAYALERLVERGEEALVRQRHAAYFLALAEKADPHLRTAGQGPWLDRLEAESGNLRAALAWFFDHGEGAGMGLRLVAALSWFWVMRSRLSEGWEWSTRALACRNDPRTDRQAAARVLLGVGSFAWQRGDLSAARGFMEESIAACRAGGSELHGELAWGLSGLAMIASFQVDRETAQAAATECLDRARELGDKWLIGLNLNPAAEASLLRHDYPAASVLLKESLALFREVGDRWAMAVPLLNHGYMDAIEGNLPAARAQLEESIASCRSVGEMDTRSRALAILAGVAQQEGNLEEAAVLYRESLDLLRRMGLEESCADAVYNLASIAEAQGHQKLAAKLFGDCLVLFERQGREEGAARCRSKLSMVPPKR